MDRASSRFDGGPLRQVRYAGYLDCSDWCRLALKKCRKRRFYGRFRLGRHSVILGDVLCPALHGLNLWPRGRVLSRLLRISAESESRAEENESLNAALLPDHPVPRDVFAEEHHVGLHGASTGRAIRNHEAREILKVELGVDIRQGGGFQGGPAGVETGQVVLEIGTA
jgi:hypothetical protein